VYASPNIRAINQGQMAGSCSQPHMGEMRNAYRNLVRKPEGKRPLGRPRISKKQDLRVQTIFIWLRIGSSGGTL